MCLCAGQYFGFFLLLWNTICLSKQMFAWQCGWCSTQPYRQQIVCTHKPLNLKEDEKVNHAEEGCAVIERWICCILKWQYLTLMLLLKGGVGNFEETSSSALELENTQLEKICHVLTKPLLQHTRTRTWPMRARDKFVHRWKADRQVGYPVILAGPAKMIGRAFYSVTASTDDILLWIFCQST